MTESKKGPFWGGAAEVWHEKKPEYIKKIDSLKKDLIEIDADIDDIDEKIKKLRDQRKKLEQEAQHAEELKKGIEEIYKLFDTDNFDTLRDRLTLLKEAEIGSIQIGKNPENNFTIDEINSFVKGVVKEYSKPKTQKMLSSSDLNEQLVSELNERGIPAEKIGRGSAQGLQECLVKCVLNMLQQNLNQTGVVSRESILGSDLRSIDELRKKIEDSK
ncbi:MAG TPA: hypothetical protein PK295_01085 [Candidatus Magasanikbacteria bacterium]|nr:hypothetical protein [Candidatus Magasanikbacteria bacterium]